MDFNARSEAVERLQESEKQRMPYHAPELTDHGQVSQRTLQSTSGSGPAPYTP